LEDKIYNYLEQEDEEGDYIPEISGSFDFLTKSVAESCEDREQYTTTPKWQIDGFPKNYSQMITNNNFGVSKKSDDSSFEWYSHTWNDKFPEYKVKENDSDAKDMVDKKNVSYKWNKEQQEAFEALKNKLITAPVLAYPVFSKTFIPFTNTSDLALGAILSQKDEKGMNK
ncbi:21235_t:CDS:2, partial [Gigaspora rosea]